MRKSFMPPYCLCGRSLHISHLSRCKINFQLDSTTAVAYVNNQGGRKSGCNGIARRMWLWATQRGITLTATYLPGVLNAVAM